MISKKGQQDQKSYEQILQPKILCIASLFVTVFAFLRNSFKICAGYLSLFSCLWRWNLRLNWAANWPVPRLSIRILKQLM